VKQSRGGLVFKAHRLVYHSTLGLRVIKKKKTFRHGLPHSWLQRNFRPKLGPNPITFSLGTPPISYSFASERTMHYPIVGYSKNTFEVRFVDEVQNYRGERVPARATQPAFNAKTSVEALLVLLLPPNSRTISGS
jgi:hypothetical protein